ncbi:MAG: CvpA family protein [Micavibrio sp.]|nr:CvpA family protein [Micavibrio sp.]
MTPAALDIIIACILALSALVAYFRGLIREIFTIIALIVASGAAYLGGDMMIPSFDKWLHVDKKVGAEAANAVSKAAASGTDASLIAHKNLIFGIVDPSLASVVCAYASVFVFFWLVMSLVGYFISRTVAESGMGILDKILGAAFGLARGFLVVFLFFLPISFLIDQEKFPDWAKNSISVPILEQAVVIVNDHVDLKKFVAENGSSFISKVNKIELKHGIKPKAEAKEDDTETRPDNSDTKDAPNDTQLQQELMQDERDTRLP